MVTSTVKEKIEKWPWKILKISWAPSCGYKSLLNLLIFTHTNVFFKHGHFEEGVTLLSPWKEAALIRVKFLILTSTIFYCQNLYFSTFLVNVLVWSITSWIYTISQGNPSILNGIHHRGSNHGVPKCYATRVYHDGVPHVYQDGVLLFQYSCTKEILPVSYTVIRFVLKLNVHIHPWIYTFIFNECPIYTTTVQVPNLALTHTKWITVYWA